MTALVFSPNWLGDAVMALPAVADIRRHAATRRLVVAARPGVAGLWTIVAGVDDVVIIPRARGRGPLADARRARRGDPPHRAPTPPCCCRTRCRRRSSPGVPAFRSGGVIAGTCEAGCSRAPCRGRAGSCTRRTTTGTWWRRSASPTALACRDSMCRRASSTGPATCWRAPGGRRARGCSASRRARHTAARSGGRPSDSPRWPPSWRARTGSCRCWSARRRMPRGHVRDRGGTGKISHRGRPAAINLAGRTDVPQLAGVLALCAAFVSNDSGAMHLAAAVGTPVVALFGPTDERVTAPVAAPRARADRRGVVPAVPAARVPARPPVHERHRCRNRRPCGGGVVVTDKRPAVFLDRDGTINLDAGYVDRLERFELYPFAIDAIRIFKQAGYLVVVLTNQAGVAHGMYGEDFVAALARVPRGPREAWRRADRRPLLLPALARRGGAEVPGRLRVPKAEARHGTAGGRGTRHRPRRGRSSSATAGATSPWPGPSAAAASS